MDTKEPWYDDDDDDCITTNNLPGAPHRYWDLVHKYIAQSSRKDRLVKSKDLYRFLDAVAVIIIL